MRRQGQRKGQGGTSSPAMLGRRGRIVRTEGERLVCRRICFARFSRKQVFRCGQGSKHELLARR